jgi:hypothetical protein
MRRGSETAVDDDGDVAMAMPNTPTTIVSPPSPDPETQEEKDGSKAE